MKKLNQRCPLQNECERVCKFEKRERNCDYYMSNSRPGFEIEDQESKVFEENFEKSIDSVNQKSLVYIAVDKIHPHHNNPRKELGDLSELAESIKTSGILQNLTVIPWVSSITGRGCDDPKQQEKMGYTVIIGHRRLAAAKLAGLKEVPCSIAEMDEKTQVATMLLENMQRSDLTIYEEAQGLQMMLDLGETLGDISHKTGFSETTVRRRVKLLDLNADKFKESVERGATLMDYAELDKIKSVELKNKVLQSIGTHNFKWELQNAIREEKSEKDKDELIKKLEEFAIRVENDEGCDIVRYLYPGDDFEKPDDSDTYYYLLGGHNIKLLKHKNKEEVAMEEDKNSIDEKKIQERRSNLQEISKKAFQLRYEFVRDYAGNKNHSKDIIEFLMTVIITDHGYFDDERIIEIMGVELDEDEEFTFEKISSSFTKSPEKVMLKTAYSMLNDSERTTYYSKYGKIEYSKNEGLDLIYKFLGKIGYQISDEEYALRNGSHELFKEEVEGSGTK